MVEVDARAISGICIYCSDPRPNLWKRIKKHIISAERQLTPIALLGGPVCLANHEFLPIEYAVVMLRQIPFALQKFQNTREIIVVGHDCGYYEQIPRSKKVTIDEKEKDVAIAAALLKRHFGSQEVVAFFAKSGGDDGFKTVHF
jgi:hypothetical protein